MTGLFAFRDRLKNFCARHELIILGVFKFIFVLVSMILIRTHIGYMTILQSVPVIIVVTVLSAFLPTGLVTVLMAAVVIANFYALSMQIALASLGILFLMFVVYYRFTPKDGVLLLIVPLLFYLRIPYVLPLVAGLVSSPLSIVSIAFGTLVYYMINTVSENAVTLTNMAADGTGSQMQYFLDQLFTNRQMFFMIGVFLFIIVVVYGIRRMSVNHAWTVAILSGGGLQLVAMILGNLFLDLKISVISIILGCLLAVLAAFVLQFFVFSVDYSRTESTQFEDDEYYYYVKAVPKINVSAPEMNVKRINAQRRNKR